MDLETDSAEDAGGYAKAMGEEFYRRQRALMGEVVAETDAVVTTAAVPGKKAPVLVTADMIASMAPGSMLFVGSSRRTSSAGAPRQAHTWSS